MPFKVCGITASSDGFGDIHCLKPWQVAASAAKAIATEMAKLNLGEDDDINDPFASGVEADLKEDEAVIEDE